jgi:hypothetical protein
MVRSFNRRLVLQIGGAASLLLPVGLIGCSTGGDPAAKRQRNGGASQRNGEYWLSEIGRIEPSVANGFNRLPDLRYGIDQSAERALEQIAHHLADVYNQPNAPQVVDRSPADESSMGGLERIARFLEDRHGISNVLPAAYTTGFNPRDNLYDLSRVHPDAPFNEFYQAVLWGVRDGVFHEGENPFAVDRRNLLRRVWGKCQGPEWEDYGIVLERANAPESIQHVMNVRFKHMVYDDPMTHTPKSPDSMFEDRVGDCRDYLYWAKEAYPGQSFRWNMDYCDPNGHSLLVIADDPREGGFRAVGNLMNMGPFDTLMRLTKSYGFEGAITAKGDYLTCPKPTVF